MRRWSVIGSFIRHKEGKVKQVFQILGLNHTEEDFINIFKRLYPDDWQIIQDLWSYEENSTPPGKRHCYAIIRCNIGETPVHLVCFTA